MVDGLGREHDRARRQTGILDPGQHRAQGDHCHLAPRLADGQQLEGGSVIRIVKTGKTDPAPVPLRLLDKRRRRVVSADQRVDPRL